MTPKWFVSPIIFLASLITPAAFAKNDKPIMPTYVLTAHTVSVIIDPEADISLDDPRANEIAQQDVETALTNWGRFNPILSTQQADLVIVIRKGHKQLVQETIHDPRASNRPGSVNPSQNSGSIGSQHVPQPGQPNDDDPMSPSSNGSRAPQLEVAGQEDYFVVYQGNIDTAPRGAYAWRWIRKDGLHPHDVPAVEEFKKAITAAEKQAAKQSPKQPAQHP